MNLTFQGYHLNKSILAPILCIALSGPTRANNQTDIDANDCFQIQREADYGIYEAYVQAVEEFLDSEDAFDHFKQHPDYTPVLEHVTSELGHGYAHQINEWLKDRAITMPWDEILRVDGVGTPTRTYFVIGGSKIFCSPTTLRYIWYAIEYAEHAKEMGLADKQGPIGFAEVGAGYAGQYAILRAMAKVLDIQIGSYLMFDIPQVMAFQKKFLDRLSLNDGTVQWQSIDSFLPRNIDFLISNYALSELPDFLQLKYFEKLVAFSSHGYIAKNGPLVDCSVSKSMLKKSIKKPEVPKTAPQNKIVLF